jgi:hypothetical protein
LRDALARGFWILNFGLAEEIGSRKGRKGGILFGNAKCGIWNLRKEKDEKRSRFADLA